MKEKDSEREIDRESAARRSEGIGKDRIGLG